MVAVTSVALFNVGDSFVNYAVRRDWWHITYMGNATD